MMRRLLPVACCLLPEGESALPRAGLRIYKYRNAASLHRHRVAIFVLHNASYADSGG